MVHQIDEVLVPLKSKSEDPAKENPNAWGFLESSNDYKIGSFQIRYLYFRDCIAFDGIDY